MNNMISINADELAKLRDAQKKLDHRKLMKAGQNERYWKKKQTIKKEAKAAANEARAAAASAESATASRPPATSASESSTASS